MIHASLRQTTAKPDSQLVAESLRKGARAVVGLVPVNREQLASTLDVVVRGAKWLAISAAAAPFVLVVGGMAVAVCGAVAGAPAGYAVGALVYGAASALGVDVEVARQAALYSGYAAAGIVTIRVGAMAVSNGVGEGSSRFV